jgi:hypothetical protein
MISAQTNNGREGRDQSSLLYRPAVDGNGVRQQSKGADGRAAVDWSLAYMGSCL